MPQRKTCRRPGCRRLQNRQSSDCGLQFGSWCALDTSLEPLLHSAADNPECTVLVTLLTLSTAAAVVQPELAPVAPGLLETTITTCMTDSPR